LISKIASKAGTAVLLVICSATFASAQIHHKYRHAHRVYAHRTYLADPSQGMSPYQANAAYAYGHVPYDPLIPLRAEVPPAVDPNEPGSGSYGAMLEGRNPAPSEP
jgi:hypothetical protein